MSAPAWGMPGLGGLPLPCQNWPFGGHSPRWWHLGVSEMIQPWSGGLVGRKESQFPLSSLSFLSPVASQIIIGVIGGIIHFEAQHSHPKASADFSFPEREIMGMIGELKHGGQRWWEWMRGKILSNKIMINDWQLAFLILEWERGSRFGGKGYVSGRRMDWGWETRGNRTFFCPLFSFFSPSLLILSNQPRVYGFAERW